MNFADVFQIVGWLHLRRLNPVVQAILANLERGCHVEDLPAVLDCDHAAVGKTATVAGAVDLVHDRRIGITRTQKVCVQRMHGTIFDRTTGGDQRLAEHLPAEDLRITNIAALAAKYIELDRFQVQQRHEVGE